MTPRPTRGGTALPLLRGGAGSRSGGGSGANLREVGKQGSRRAGAKVTAAVIVGDPCRPPSLARDRGVRWELAGGKQGGGTL